MLSLPDPPDFAVLAAAARARGSDLDDPLQSGLDRRQMPRRDVAAAVYLGVVPATCERVRLSRVPVTVFKPALGAWAFNLSPSGVAVLTAEPVEVRLRQWVRLDHVADRPTILPGRVEACDELDTSEDGLYLLRLRFLMEDADISRRLGFLPRRAAA